MSICKKENNFMKWNEQKDNKLDAYIVTMSTEFLYICMYVFMNKCMSVCVYLYE